MATGDNATILQTNKTNWEGPSGAPATRRPRDFMEGAAGTAQFSGNASTTVFNIPHVTARKYDPVREETYRRMGIHTICPTTTIASLILSSITTA